LVLLNRVRCLFSSSPKPQVFEEIKTSFQFKFLLYGLSEQDLSYDTSGVGAGDGPHSLANF